MENNNTVNLTNFARCKNITEKDVLEFLKSAGYHVSDFKCTVVQTDNIDEYEINHLFSFNNYDEFDYQTYNHRLILLASPYDWKITGLFNNISEHHSSTKCNNNPFVRYIYFNISEFKVYEVVKDKKYPKHLTTKLDYDLSKEWVQFLAQRKEEYKPSLIKLMIRRKKQAEEDLQCSKDHVENEKAKLDQYLEEKITSTNKEINSINTTTEWLNEIK